MENKYGRYEWHFECAEKLSNSKRFVFAVLAAVYGHADLCMPEAIIFLKCPLAPPKSLWVLWKLGGGTSCLRLFHDNTKVPTVCLRFEYNIWKGRDKGNFGT